jgi:hypothetical protein
MSANCLRKCTRRLKALGRIRQEWFHNELVTQSPGVNL